MNESEDKSKIDELNKSLYSREAPDILTKRKMRFQEQDSNVNTDWEHPQENPDQFDLDNQIKHTPMSFFTKFLLTSIVFFLVALGIGAILVFNGSNIVSANNVDIKVSAPASVSGGEAIPFGIQITNHNNIVLENVNLSVDFPSGTVDAEDSLKELKNFRTPLDNISPEGIGQKDMNIVLYGEENTKKEVKVSIQYRVKGSNATFTKEKIFDLLIASSPLSLSVSSFKEVNSGQEFDLELTMKSNSREVMKSLLLKAIYPFGFSFISSDMKNSADNSVWKIGDIPPGGKKTIKIRGKLEGQDDEVRVFRFSVGSARLGSDKLIATEYISSAQEVSIKKPFMTVDLAFNGDSSSKEFVSYFNNSVRVDISYFNNLQTSINDAEVHVKLSGSAFDKTFVSPDNGLYKSANNEIVWNSITTPELRSIEAGGSGRISFSITPKDFSTAARPVTNPNLKFVVSVKGKRNSESNVPESITSTAEKTVKISSNASLGGQIVRSSGPFANTGPIPPKAEQQTTYTVIWTVDNTANNISNAQVHSSLPPYVKWLGNVSPTAEDITYDKVSGEVLWNVGSLGTYTAGSSRRKQVAFQISFNPSINQVNQSPVLVNQASLSAQDDFTDETLKSNLGVMTTRFSTDSSFKDGDEKVVK